MFLGRGDVADPRRLHEVTIDQAGKMLDVARSSSRRGRPTYTSPCTLVDSLNPLRIVSLVGFMRSCYMHAQLSQAGFVVRSGVVLDGLSDVLRWSECSVACFGWRYVERSVTRPVGMI